MDELTLFKDVHKGNVTQADKGIRWELGEIVLIFYLDKVEDYCSVLLKGKKRERELTHLHLSREETIDLICAAINAVSFSQNRGKKPDTIEGRIVQDADRLDALGAISIARAFAYGGEHGRPLHESVQHLRKCVEC